MDTRSSKGNKLSKHGKTHNAMDAQIFKLKVLGRELAKKLALVHGTNNQARWVGADTIVVRVF